MIDLWRLDSDTNLTMPPVNTGMRLKEAQIKPNLVERSSLGAEVGGMHVPHPPCVCSVSTL